MPYIPQGADPWLIPTPDSSRHYRWLNSNPMRLGLWLRAFGSVPGYRLERGATIEDTKRIADTLGLSAESVDLATNRIAYGHNVLASIPIEEYARRSAAQVDEQLEKIAEVEDSAFANIDNIKGVRAFKEHPDEMKERERHAVRGMTGSRPLSGQTGVGTSPGLRKQRVSGSAQGG